jgi:3-oxoacyl-[acyl-carrier protein] reductase
MILQKSGNIINISTVSALQPSPGQAAYSASKAAIESLTRTLAMEHGKYNIRVNSIAPGLIQTEIVKSITQELKDEVLKKTPLGKFGTPKDIADAAVFLASDFSSYITGIQLLVTGGRHLF